MLSSPVSAVKERGGRMWLRPLPLHRLLQAVLAIGAAGLSHRAPKLRIGQDALAMFAGRRWPRERNPKGLRQRIARPRNLWAGLEAQDDAGRTVAEVQPGGEGEGDHGATAIRSAFYGFGLACSHIS